LISGDHMLINTASETNHYLVRSKQYGKMMVGQVVRSLKGRDAGKAYVIVGMDVKGRLKVCDGFKRRLAKPKLKNGIHLEPIAEMPEVVSLIKANRLTDEDIRQILGRVQDNFSEEVDDIGQRRCD
jgi:large subunit ribosomal protein L14e